MGFHVIDGYLLDGRPDKRETIAAVLRERSAAARAQPFYRALEAVGVRAADEALVALRLVLADREPADDAVRRLRALARVARSQDAADQARTIAQAAPLLADLDSQSGRADELAAAARAAYGATF